MSACFYRLHLHVKRAAMQISSWRVKWQAEETQLRNAVDYSYGDDRRGGTHSILTELVVNVTKQTI